MPDPFNRAKMSGDTHPPEVESDLPLEEGSAQAPAIPRSPRERGVAGDSGDSDGKPRDSGESGPSQR